MKITEQIQIQIDDIHNRLNYLKDIQDNSTFIKRGKLSLAIIKLRFAQEIAGINEDDLRIEKILDEVKQLI